MRNNLNKYEKFVLMMMTDGQAGYPDKAVKDIKSEKDIMAKMTFKSVAYGGGSKELEKMSNELSGEFVATMQAN